MAAPLYLYGIVESGANIPRGLRGVGGNAVRLETQHELGVLVTDLPAAAYEARREDLVAHSDVLQAVIESTDVLPMGFGTVFESPDELTNTFLQPNHAALLRMLADMKGLVEVQVRADYEQDAIALEIASSDRSIQKLQARVRSRDDVESKIELGRRFANALEKRRYADASALVDRLAPFARTAYLGEAAGEYGLLRASFLVARDELARFDEAAEAAAAALQGHATVRCIGPLPPYSFVDASALAVA